MSEARIATYRVQLRPEFGFDSALALVDYWAALGVSHLYASPYLQAAAGSAHGYDVVDHRRVNEELGGDTGRLRLCAALREHGLRQLLDVVPNHMAIRGGHNAWWWDVLENGPASRYSSYFDVEWQSGTLDRVLLPVLGDQYGVELEHGHLALRRNEGSFVIQYFEHEMPMSPRVLGRVLRDAAERTTSEELGFLADAFLDLPIASATDYQSRRRRDRDKQVLQRALARLFSAEPNLAGTVDEVLAHLNADPNQLHEVLERQNYRLAYWRAGNRELDYRRFFDIDTLVGLRVEEDEVFHATHALPLRWLSEGTIDGLRIDHIDGLYDPQGYLKRLEELAPGAWVLVEKILEGDEALRTLPAAGTTGYDFLNHVQRLLMDPAGQAPLAELHRAMNPEETDYAALVARSKRGALEQALGSDLKRLAERLAEICYKKRRYRDFSRVELTRALSEVCVAFPVYRSYLKSSDIEPHPEDRAIVEQACAAAQAANPDLDPHLFEFLQQLLLLTWRDAAEVEFVMRWQQLTGPATAKGVEDTTFYRFATLVALNEVGGDPSHFSETPEQFHAWVTARAERQACPLNATSTHDTKRSEDVRARLLVLSEVPDRWREAVGRWRARLAAARVRCPPANLDQAPEPALEYFLLQNLVGAWPIERERMLAYAQKAMRESSRYSSWLQPNEPYEKAVSEYLEILYGDRELVEDIDGFVRSIADAGYANSLNQLLLKALTPGVPDIYQGTELWDFSLVDPDNRRPVDYELRRRVLRELPGLAPEELWAARADGRIKAHFLRELLSLRARQPAAFAASANYEPLTASGPERERVVAFVRSPSAIAIATRWFSRASQNLRGTSLTLPPGRWRNVLTRTEHFSGRVALDQLLGPFPAAALEREAEAMNP